jgi:hypothetical protein
MSDRWWPCGDREALRCKWYVGLALFSTLAVARIDGISSADVA